jgi:hypothetical protein
MPKEYAKIAYLIGKGIGEKRKAIASKPLPQRLAELLRRLLESDKAEQRNSDRQESRDGEG